MIDPIVKGVGLHGDVSLGLLGFLPTSVFIHLFTFWCVRATIESIGNSVIV